MRALLSNYPCQKGGAHARRSRLDDEINLVGARYDPRFKAVPSACVHNHAVQCKPGFEENERNHAQCRKVKGLTLRKTNGHRLAEQQGAQA